jgi:dihydrofolate reductase/thymidylate synthase
MALPPCHILA